MKPLAERFWAKVDKAGPVPAHAPELGPCWLWTGARLPRGYGQIRLGRRNEGQEYAHRVSWFLARGTWPTLEVLHRCDTPACVRPDHLFEGTQGDNLHDMEQKGRARHPANPGERNGNARITESQAREILRQKALGRLSPEIARNLGIAPVSRVTSVGSRTWLHLLPEQQTATGGNPT